MEYVEVQRPVGDGLCSDDKCPCPEVRIPRGTGYLYISQQVVDFRQDARSEEEAKEKMERIVWQLEQQYRQPLSEPDLFVVMSPRWAVPILVCEQAAKLRGLDLEVAAADAKYWWETGLVPLRATPLASGGSVPSKPSE